MFIVFQVIIVALCIYKNKEKINNIFIYAIALTIIATISPINMQKRYNSSRRISKLMSIFCKYIENYFPKPESTIFCQVPWKTYQYIYTYIKLVIKYIKILKWRNIRGHSFWEFLCKRLSRNHNLKN